MSRLAEVLTRVSRKESELRSGRFEVVLDLGGQRSVADMRFDLGDQTLDARLHTTTTYVGSESSRTQERITIDEQSWQRQQGGRWLSVPEDEGVWGRLQEYLPGVSAVREVALQSSDSRVSILRWRDDVRGADVSLQVDTATGTPLKLSRQDRATATDLTVTYTGWNVPVEVVPPETR